MKEKYYKYSEFLKEEFGEKIYKLPISLDLTCPNRDGTCGRGGCIFCSEEGGSHENLDNKLSIKDQLIKNKEYIGSRYNAKKYIAYFQSFTNTYMPFYDFKKNMEEVMEVEDIVGISISTRPDSISDEILDYLASLKEDYLITIEYGLQSINNYTLEKINRGHSFSDFIDATLRTKDRGLRVCVHMILNLPWDSMDDIIEASKIMSILKVDEVKLHSLYIVEGTMMAKMYKNNEFEIISKDEFIDRVCYFLAYLNKDISVQRLLSRAPKEVTLFCNWDTSWWKIQDEIMDRMDELELIQGSLCKY